MYLSILIPVFNEQDSIRQLYDALSPVLKQLKRDYEIIFVDDGSTDNTYANLLSLKKENSHVKIISFIKNFGKSAALNAGFAKAKGDFIITMDGDLEDDPKEIPKFLESISKGYDMVVGWRFKRKHTFTKKTFSRIYNLLIRLTIGLNIHDSNCGFKIMKKEVAKYLNVYGEMHRYMPSVAKLNGFRVSEVKISHTNRKFGKSKYGSLRIFKGFFDLLTINFLSRYSLRPLHFFGSIGFLLFFTGSATVSFLYIRKFLFGIPIGTLPFLFILGVLSIILGIQFISLGLIGEIIIRGRNHNNYILK